MSSIETLHQSSKLRRRTFQNLKISTLKSISLASDETVNDFEKERIIKENTGVSPVSCNGDNFEEFYQKIQKLGEGAHSVVHSFKHKKTQKIYAVKFLKSCDKERINQFTDTFLLNQKLSHPFIIRDEYIYFNKQHSKVYLVSQMCSYRNLRHFINSEKSQGKKIQQETAIGIIKNLLQCIKYLKEKGVCHRDIKPENILYDPKTGNIKLIDFEIAKMKKQEDEALELWTPVGTYHYRAPQSYALGYSQTVDIWAVGIIALELLTGQSPLAMKPLKSSNHFLFGKTLKFDNLQLSCQAKHFLENMLEKDPKKRFTPQQALESQFMTQRNTKQNKKENQIQKAETEGDIHFSSELAQIPESPISQSILTPEAEKNNFSFRSKFFQSWDKFIEKDKPQEAGSLGSSFSTAISSTDYTEDFNNEEELGDSCSSLLGLFNQDQA